MESILTSIKKLLGPEEVYDNFDTDIIMHINDAFMTLNQLGVGPSEGFVIEDDTALWEDFLPEADLKKMQSVKTYVYINVKLVFDSSSLSSSYIATLERKKSEIEWRLNHAAETSVATATTVS